MNGSDVRGLIGSMGKALALAPQTETTLERLEGIDSRDDFEAFLRGANLGVEPPAKDAFIEAVTGENWRDYHAQLATSANLQHHEYRTPSA